MKFGKNCEEVCETLYQTTRVPPFPYKRLKKQLKTVRDANSKDPRLEFYRFLLREVRAVDAVWKRTARAALKAERTPLMSMAYATIGLGSRSATPDLLMSLSAWSNIARTGLRKIKKKYNKQLADSCGQLEAIECSEVEAFAFADIPAREIAHGQHGNIETHSIV